MHWTYSQRVGVTGCSILFKMIAYKAYRQGDDMEKAPGSYIWSHLSGKKGHRSLRRDSYRWIL